MLIFTDASQMSEKACLAKAQRNRARLKAQRIQGKLKVDDEKCVHQSTCCSHDLPLFQNRCHWTVFKGCIFLQSELLKRHKSQSWLEFKLLLSHFSRVRLCATPQTAAHQAPLPWDSPGKNTGVGCHFILQCMKVKSESEVAQLCPTLSNPMDWTPPGSSIHGIFQARVLEWGAIAFFRI